MIFVACSGFPVPVSRYWGDFMAVELSDTELGIPGQGTVRRWIRESPDGFQFTIRAPKVIAESGFAKTKENRELMKEFAVLFKTLNAKAAVFIAPESFKPTRSNKAAVQAFCSSLPASIPRVVLDFPSWKPSIVHETAAKRKVSAAYDPLNDVPPKDKAFAYLRLPGPAGHRSRYDEPSLDEIARLCQVASEQSQSVFCTFRNIDMHANGKSLRTLLGD